MLFLFVVIWLSLDDGAGTVELFGEDESYHLVGERETRQGYLFVGPLIDGRGEAVGTSDDEYQSAGCGTLVLQPLGEVGAGALLAPFVQQYDGVLRGELVEDECALSLFLLVGAQRTCVLEFGYDLYLEGHVMADALDVVGDG